MRGGPINTRRVLLQSSNLSPDQSLCSSDSDVIEQSQIQALMEKHREKIMEGMPKNGQVTVLLFRDGDKLNLYHVLEKPDGSFSPVASATPRSLSGSARSTRSAHYPQFWSIDFSQSSGLGFMVTFYLWRSGSNAQVEVEGHGRAPCQCKMPFQY